MNPEVSPLLQSAANESAHSPLDSLTPLLAAPESSGPPWAGTLFAAQPDERAHAGSSLRDPPLERLAPLESCKRELDAVLASLDP